jgi:hypothetical protein
MTFDRALDGALVGDRAQTAGAEALRRFAGEVECARFGAAADPFTACSETPIRAAAWRATPVSASASIYSRCLAGVRPSVR